MYWGFFALKIASGGTGDFMLDGINNYNDTGYMALASK